jgi:hypothetical protein
MLQTLMWIFKLVVSNGAVCDLDIVENYLFSPHVATVDLECNHKPSMMLRYSFVWLWLLLGSDLYFSVLHYAYSHVSTDFFNEPATRAIDYIKKKNKSRLSKQQRNNTGGCIGISTRAVANLTQTYNNSRSQP